MNIGKKIINFLSKPYNKYLVWKSLRMRKKIVKMCPNLYRDVLEKRGPRDTLMYFGFEIGDGWLKLLKKTSIKLEKEIKKLPKYERPLFRAIQVKEKWGTLSIYVTYSTDNMYDIIDKAEEKSAEICEICGKKGRLRDGGWIRALCDKCAKKLNY